VLTLIHAQLIFKIAAAFYGLSLLSAFLFGRRREMVWLFLFPAMLANALTVVLRYRLAWPMLPMHLGPVALPFVLGFLMVFNRQENDDGVMVRRTLLALTVVIALSAVCFPKDFYLPFLKSQTALAHLFFWLGVAGKGCFLFAAAWALAGLRRPLYPFLLSLRWTVWGFALWTFSMFSGELWSYLGWGTPVVWDDPAITTTMATWFFYVCLLHLHLTGTWTARGRGAYAAAGALVILGLNGIPDLGPFRWPL
jgi:hypothetical protein